MSVISICVKCQITAMYNFSDYVSNSSADEDLDFVPYSARIETYLVPILFSVIFIVGIIGNWTVCIIFIKHPSMRNVPNTYVDTQILKCPEDARNFQEEGSEKVVK